MLEINRKFWCKNDRFMMGVLYGGVWGFGGGRCIITTTGNRFGLISISYEILQKWLILSI